MKPTKPIEISESNVINFASSIAVSESAVSAISARISETLNATQNSIPKKLAAAVRITFLLFFGSSRELWDVILHDILGVPRGRYTPNARQRVLHCPICGAPGMPNGTTKACTHQYICTSGKHKTFTEKSSAEYKLFKYLLYLKALQLLKSGLSVTLISMILGISRTSLADAFAKLDVRRIAKNMKDTVIAVIKSLISRGRCPLLVIDTTFVGGVAVILLRVQKDRNSITMHVAEAEREKSIVKAIGFLRERLTPQEQKKLIFLSDGSIHIFKACRSLFPQVIHIRQFHNERHLGLIHIHFAYGETRYTLVLRWDYFVQRNQRMYHVRGLLPGERMLRDDEVMLYEGDLLVPPTDLSEEERERKANECIGAAEFLSHLDIAIRNDYERFKEYGKGGYPPRVRREINIFVKTKTFLVGEPHRCRTVNAMIIRGLEVVVERIDFSMYSSRYLSRIYRAFSRLALCNPTKQEKQRFKELKSRLLKILRDRLVEDGLLRVAEVPRSTHTSQRRAKMVFRGYPEEMGEGEREIYSSVIYKIEPYFAGRYITSNSIEGYFGRVKVLVEQHRNIISSPRSLYFVFWRSPVCITNRKRMIFELMDDYPLEYVFSDCAEAEHRDCTATASKVEGCRGSSMDVEEIEVASRKLSGLLEVGGIYEVRYKNRRKEEKVLQVEVLNVFRRKRTVKKTWYLVVYLDSGEVRTLRADRVKRATKI